MKTISKATVALVLALVMMLGLGTTALAAGSKSDVVEVTPTEGVTIAEADKEVPALTEEIAAKEIDGKDAKDLQVLWQKDVSAKLPAELTFTASGVSSERTLYLFHWNGTKWEKIDQGKAPSITHKFGEGELSPVGLVVDKAASSSDNTNNGGNNSNTPKTGDTRSTMLWASLMVVAAAGAIGTAVYSKKRHA